MYEAIIPLIPQFLWATNFVVSKVVVSSGLHPLLLTAVRWTIAGALLYVYARVAGLRLSFSKDLVIPALTGITGFSALIYLGLMFSKASIVGLTMSFIPIATSILASMVLKERISNLLKLSIAFGTLGGLLLSAGGLTNLSWLGVLFGIAASLDWGIYTVWSKKAMLSLSPMELLVSIALMAQPLNWLIALPFLTLAPFQNPFVTLGVLYVALVPGFLAYFFWLYSVKLVGASRAGVYINALPLFTLLVAIATLHETLDFLEIMGALNIMIALALVTMDFLRKA